MLQTLERLILDPISETPPYQVTTNRPFELTGLRAPSPEGHGVFLVNHSYPRPDSTATYASSRDSQGEVKFGKPKLANRKIPITVYLTEAQGVGSMTNLAINPAGELAKKFVDGADYPTVRQMGTAAIPAAVGEFRDQHTFDGTFSNAVVGTLNFTFPAAGTYTVSCMLWVPSSWDGGKLRWNASSYTGQVVTFGAEADMTKRDQWQRVWSTVKVEAADLVGVLTIGALTPPSSSATGVVYTDAVQVESGSAPTPWAYGDTPGCEWNGAPNASTSTRYGSGSDKKRFIRSWFELQTKIEKLSEEQGTFKRVLPDGSWMVFDVLDASFSGNWEKRFNQGQEEFTFELTCKPGARLEPITLTAHEEKSLPILKFTETVIPGNMPALGDLMIEDIQGVDRKFAAISVASRFLDTSANGDVFYEAESRLRLGSSALAAGSGIPSGSEANKVVSSTLFATNTPIISTRAKAGEYTTHVGAHKVFARIWRPETNAGEVSVGFEYAQGDLLRWKQLKSITYPANMLEGCWMIVELGVVRLNLATIGMQRWEGRLVGSSTSLGDTIQVDWLAVLPVEEFYGEAKALTIPPSTIGSEIAGDNFAGSAAALTGQEGFAGKWSYPGEGSATDFTEVPSQPGVLRQLSSFDVSGANNDPAVYRSLPATGRYVRLGTGTQIDVTVAASIAPFSGYDGAATRTGVFARYVNMKNLIMARWVCVPYTVPGTRRENSLEVWKKVEGTWTQLYVAAFNWLMPILIGRLTLHIGANGAGYVYLKYNETTITGGALSNPVNGSTNDVDLATGGKLATGGFGIHNTIAAVMGKSEITGSGIQQFAVYAGADTAHDAVIYANRKMRVRWDQTTREAEDGSGAFPEVGNWEGDRLLIPQSGRELRPVRVAILTSREIPETAIDVQADDTKATLTVTPRTIEVPQPAVS